MTAINRLTTKPTLSDLDFIPIWDVTAGRTRNIQASSIKTFIADMIPDNDPVIGGSIDNGELSLETKSGQTIDIGSISGVKVENDFITQIYVDSGIQVLIEDGAATISQNITKSIWPIQTITIGESPLSIDSPDQYGIDYEFSYNQSTAMSPSVLLFNAQEGAQIKVSTIGMAKESRPVTVSQLTSGEQEVFWYVTTPTVFMFHEDRWRVEESSQLTHVDGNTTFDSPATKTPVIGISAKPGSSITTEVEGGVLLIGGGVGQDIDIDDYQRKDDPAPNYKRYDIETNGSGQPNFTASIHQDDEYQTIIDATKNLIINYKDISTGVITPVMNIDNNQAQFHVPILQGDDEVALKKDLPAIPENGYVEKYTRADLDYIRVAYGGRYNSDRTFYPVQLNQDSNGWTHLVFTGYMQFQSSDKATGEKGDVALELRSNRVINKVQPYFNDYKMAVRANNNIVNTSSLADVINSEGGSVNNWISANPDYTPQELLDQIFNSTVVGVNDFQIELTLASNDYNGTVPNRFGKWVIRRSSDITRNYMYVHTKGSSDVYRAPYIQGEAPHWSLIAYASDIANDKAKGEWIGGVFKDTINDDGNPEDAFTCNNPKHWLEYRKTTFNGGFALTVNQGSDLISSEIVINLHAESGMTSAPFKIVTNDGKALEKTIRMGEKWRFFLRKGTWPYAEKIDDGMQSGQTGSDYDGEGFGVPGRTDTGHGVIVQKVITGNYRNTSNETGDLTINLRTDDGVTNFRLYYSMPHGTLSARKVYVKVDEKAGLNKTIRAGEIWLCQVKAGRFFDDFFWSKVTDGESTFEAIDTSSFEPIEAKIMKKKFENKDLISLPIELPEGFEILVSSVICKIDGKLRKQPFEYQYENGILRVHLNEVCSGIVIAELIR